MKRFVLPSVLFVLWVVVTAGLAWAVYINRQGIDLKVANIEDAVGLDGIERGITRRLNSVSDVWDQASDSVSSAVSSSVNGAQDSITHSIEGARDGMRAYFMNAGYKAARSVHTMAEGVDDAFGTVLETAFSVLEVEEKKPSSKPRLAQEDRKSGFINASFDMSVPPPPPLTLSEIKKRKTEDEIARINAEISPAASPQTWNPDQKDLTIEAVLVPRQVTVISSSQDGRIAEIPVSHGDKFKKGDLLIAYDCSDLEAEADIVRLEKDLTKRKVEGSDKLFKLDIISDVDRLGAQVEDKQVEAKSKLYAARMKDCQIRAEFDGRVTNRLANPGEYTRTDRVLLEVASDEPLQAEFLLPSKWLRWVNVGAPINITIGETERSYTAKIRRIHGEVDPVSQSIQVIATLDAYDDPLLPGMSGQAKINVDDIRQSGVRGYLENVSYRR